MITILSVLLIVVGILFVILSIQEYDKTHEGKHNKIILFIDLVSGCLYIITGLLVVLKIISGRYLILLAFLFSTLNRLINHKVKTQKL